MIHNTLSKSINFEKNSIFDPNYLSVYIIYQQTKYSIV